MTTQKPKLSGSQDLLTYFNLLPIYNKMVKPYPPSDRQSGIDPTLFPYISDLPGKLEFEPDGYLLGLMRDPQAVEHGPEIKPLDSDTLREAFSLREGPIPGFDASILGTDDISGGNEGGQTQSYGEGSNTMGGTGTIDEGERRHKKKVNKYT
ncbi:hypothetical protein BY458DRAFT_504858 [Sporodiniella umbellata]|nr:hypothetical protein BY458DRAFT_504858 [Sporodiniella umbellata]